MPHSDILGSKPVCGSPKLFAAYHVLHRLLAPRHSPYALSSLTIRNSRLTPIAGSRLAGSRVRTCRTANRELRIAACDSPLHTACVLTPPALAGAVDCGRKKLPFAGYSVVKDQRRSGPVGPPRICVLRSWGPDAPLRSHALSKIDRSPGWFVNSLTLEFTNSPTRIGGEYRARTGDLLVANQALSQLS